MGNGRIGKLLKNNVYNFDRVPTNQVVGGSNPSGRAKKKQALKRTAERRFLRFGDLGRFWGDFGSATLFAGGDRYARCSLLLLTPVWG